MSFLKALAKSEPYRGGLSGTLNTAPSQLVVQSPSPPESRRQSWVFDQHVVHESSFGRNAGKGSAKMPQAISLAYDERGRWAIDAAPMSWLGMTPRERKETLLQIYLANPWIASCIRIITSYIISGGFTIEPNVENPDTSQYDQIKKLLFEVNQDWNFNTYISGVLKDLLIYGEAFSEFLLGRDGLPYQLYKIDCITMDTEFDQWGRITAFKQQLASTTQTNWCNPKTILRWWNPHPRSSIDPFSTIETIQDPVWLDKQMVNWQTNFFRNGGKYPYYIKGVTDSDEADRVQVYWRENFTGIKNAHKIPVLWGEAELAAMGSDGPIDMSFDKGLDRTQSTVFSSFGVPPTLACLAEVGNRLTDMSDGQRLIMEYIVCAPLINCIFGDFNYRVIHPFFGKDYSVSSRFADFRSSEAVANVQNTRINNGTLLRDEARQEMGKEPYKDGSGGVPTITTTKEFIPLPRIKDLEDEQRASAQATLDTAKANADLATTKAKQAKETPQQQGDQGKDTDGQDQTKTPQGKGKATKNDEETESAGQQSLSENAGNDAGLLRPRDLSGLQGDDLARHLLYLEGQKRGVLCLTQ